MSENYEPDPEVTATSPLTTVFLSQRDLGLQVPINFVTQPGVSFSAACFPFQKYEDDSSGDCLSNLLAEGFRRFELDLYWDQGRQLWSFCPVAIPTSIPNAIPSSTTTLTFSTTTRGALTSDAEPTTASTSTGTGAGKSSVSGIGKRQIASDGSSISTDATSTDATSITPTETVSGSSLGTSLPSLTVLPDSSNTPLVKIGPFICTTTINLSTFTSQLNDYFEKTETTLAAHLIYVIMNLHAAASENDPTAPAPFATTLPESSNMLGELYSANLSAFMYTPSNLRADRANLNSSWYTVKESYRPVQDYYSVERTATGIATTSDGWPSESFIEFSRSKRLLLGFGNSDPQIAAYNFTGDENTIFSSGYIQSQPENITASTSGQVTNGCYILNATDDLSTVNSSWATAANIVGFDYATASTSLLTPTLNLSSNLTNCGISPILNVTLLDTSANDNYIPYQNFSYSTIWSWAPDEPKNFTTGNTGTDSLFRCATANLGLSGRWVVQDCSQKYYASCRADGQPYNWTLTTYPISYSFADQACPDSYKFAAPRTALENAYLSQAMRDSRRDFDGRGAWVDFNSLDVKGCWTMGGPNATCPYSESVASADDLKRRTILIPTVAAIVVLIITALTVFAKAAGNRKTKRRKTRRVNNGFIYEGVPS